MATPLITYGASGSRASERPATEGLPIPTAEACGERGGSAEESMTGRFEWRVSVPEGMAAEVSLRLWGDGGPDRGVTSHTTSARATTRLCWGWG